MSEVKHTTTPWRLDECCYGDNIIEGPNDEIIMWDTPANNITPSLNDMRHIVKCVNMHDELVRALLVIATNSLEQPSIYVAEEALKKAGAL